MIVNNGDVFESPYGRHRHPSAQHRVEHAPRELPQGDAVSDRTIDAEEALAIAERRMGYEGDTRDCARTLVAAYKIIEARDAALAEAKTERDRSYLKMDNATSKMKAMAEAVRELLVIETDEDESAAAIVRQAKAKLRLLVKLAKMIEVTK